MFPSVLLYRLVRRKQIDKTLLETPLKRCLSTFDLVLFGIGHMIGAGIWVYTGIVAKQHAGPAVLLSYVFAGVAAILAALCYAEFATKIPKAGSSYNYCYVVLGEFSAFLTGWNMVAEYIVGASSVASAFSSTVDELCNGQIANWSYSTFYWWPSTNWMTPYPDLLAAAIIILFGVVASFGVNWSVRASNVLTGINLLAIALVVVIGLVLTDVTNWINEGHGGFTPFGFGGVISGAALLFYSYNGFDGIAVAGEETTSPVKTIPRSTFISMGAVTIIYVSAAMALTLMVPYYSMNEGSPFAVALRERNVIWASYVVAISSLTGMSTTMFGNIFSGARLMYAMAEDGLLFKLLGRVHQRTQTPIISTVIIATAAVVLAVIVNLETLAEFVSIGTLFVFTTVAASVIVIHYWPYHSCPFDMDGIDSSGEAVNIEMLEKYKNIGILKPVFRHLFIAPYMKNSRTVILSSILIMSLSMAGFSGIQWNFNLINKSLAIALMCFCVFVIIIAVCVIIMFEKNTYFTSFQLPLVPIVPALSMFVNIELLMKLQVTTWTRFAVWVLVGLGIYFSYGVWFSAENYKPLVADVGPTRSDLIRKHDVVCYGATDGIIRRGLANE